MKDIGLSSLLHICLCSASSVLEHAINSPFIIADGNYEKAIECAKTYLLFFPHDEVMNQNLAYYTAVLGENLARPIQPRKVSSQKDERLQAHLLFSLGTFAEAVGSPPYQLPKVDRNGWI